MQQSPGGGGGEDAGYLCWRSRGLWELWAARDSLRAQPPRGLNEKDPAVGRCGEDRSGQRSQQIPEVELTLECWWHRTGLAGTERGRQAGSGAQGHRRGGLGIDHAGQPRPGLLACPGLPGSSGLSASNCSVLGSGVGDSRLPPSRGRFAPCVWKAFSVLLLMCVLTCTAPRAPATLLTLACAELSSCSCAG